MSATEPSAITSDTGFWVSRKANAITESSVNGSPEIAKYGSMTVSP